MPHFKHSELVERYHVSLKTIHNWIDGAKQGKINLRLHHQNSRTYIADTVENVTMLEKLAEKGKKYRNTLHHKVVSPQPEFYKLYSRRQILDIISNVKIRREIPRQYNYKGDGAESWNAWVHRLQDEDTPNILKATIELIHNNLGSIDLLLQNATRVNIVDLGAGNAFPVKELLTHLRDKDMLHRYIAIDISEKMLQIAERNVREWFGNTVRFEGHIRDITHEHFDDILLKDMIDNQSDSTVNMALLFGATLVNFRSPADVLKVIYGSLGEKDLLAHTTVKTRPDTEIPRRYFELNTRPRSSTLASTHSYILELLNIDESLYEAEMGFDEQKRMRFVRIRLKTALTIKFKFDSSELAVSLEKGDAILLLRVWHQTTLEIISEFEEAGFNLLQSSLSKEGQYLLSISGIKPHNELDLP